MGIETSTDGDEIARSTGQRCDLIKVRYGTQHDTAVYQHGTTVVGYTAAPSTCSA